MMHPSKMSALAVVSAAAALIALSPNASAQREVRWQINTLGFPADASVFIDVQDGPNFTRNLPASAFALSMDEYAGDQGGWITNGQGPIAGQAGGLALVLIDVSRTYTGQFERAKRMAKAIVDGMQADRDQVAIATFPTQGGYAAARLLQPFGSNKAALASAIDKIQPLPDGDETGARMCDSLNEGLKFFPESVKNKYRTVIFITGGADKGEGKGDCVQSSYYAGKVPFYSIVFDLDRKFDDPRNAHKIENGAYDLAQKTGGQSSFRRSDSEIAQFIGMFWNRVRAQYQLQVTFPCFSPAPAIEHVSMLKVEGRDSEGIKFQATSAQAPVPAITALYPTGAPRKEIDDGKIDLTIDGTGFCGGQGGIQVTVNGAPVQVKSANPFRVVAALNKAVDTGTVAVTNRFRQTGESVPKFEVIKVKGAEASSTLTILVIVVVALVVLAVLLVALKSRKGKSSPKPASPAVSAPPARPYSASPAPVQAPVPSAAPAPVTLSTPPQTASLHPLRGAFVVRADGSRIALSPGQNLIGREVQCVVKLEIPGVSREHARIDYDPETKALFITDLGSTNGTHVGPKGSQQAQAIRIAERTPWTADDAVWIGGERLLAVIDGGREG